MQMRSVEAAVNAYGIPWYGWLLIILCGIKPLLMPFFIGKKREPLTATDCCVNLIVTVFFIWAIVELAIA